MAVDMQAPYATVTLGPIVQVVGVLPSTAPKLLEAIGAFEHAGSWWVPAADWKRAESRLRGIGVALTVKGELPVSSTQVEGRRVVISLLPGDVIRVQGDMPRYIRKHWLGRERHDGYVGMSPWALEDFIKTAEAEGVQVTLGDDARAFRERLATTRRLVDGIKSHPLPVVALRAPERLRPYQQEAIGLGEAMNGRFHVEFDVGVGKTLTGIGWHRHVNSQRTLVICPSIAKGNWVEEIRRFDGSRVSVLDGFRNGNAALPATPWVITGLDTLLDTEAGHKGWMPAIRDWKPDLVIVDEAHLARGTRSLRSDGMRQACKVAKHAVLMTGTAMSEGPIDLWSQLDALQPGWWGQTWFDYAQAFCAAKEKTRFAGNKRWKYWDVTGASHADVLAERLKYVMIRRTAKDVKLQLPPQTRIPLHVELTPQERHQYDAIEREYRDIIAKVKGASQVERETILDDTKGQRLRLLGRMRQVSSAGRILATVDEVENWVQQVKRPVVFGYFTDSLGGIRMGLQQKGLRVGYIDGGTSRPQRDAVRESFTAGRLDVLCGQIEAMGMAINLQSASDLTLTHDMTYRPLDIIQSEGRVFRSGQENPVTHYYSIGVHTSDNRILDILLTKLANIEAVHAGSDVEGEVQRALDSDFFGG